MTDPELCELCGRAPAAGDRILYNSVVQQAVCGRCYDAIFYGDATSISPLDARRQTPDASVPSDGGKDDPYPGTSRAKADDEENGYRQRLEDLAMIGQLEPWRIHLDASRLPSQATVTRALVAALERYFGLRLAYGDFRPVPLSRGFVAQLLGWRDIRGNLDRTRAREQLRTLLRYGVLVDAGELEGKGDWRGARLYLPPEPFATELGYEQPLGVAAGDGAGEREARLVEAAVPEPDAELAEQPCVDGAQPAVGEDDWMVAVRFEAPR